MTATPAPTDRGERMSTPTPSRDPRDWVGAKHPVRAFYASDRSATRCVGRVISYTDQPTVTVEMPDGSRESWLASLCEPTAEPIAEILPAASAPQGDTLREVAAELADGMARIAGLLGLDVEAGEVGPIVERVQALVRQGDTADVIERAAAIIHKNACDCGPSSGHSAEFQHEFGEPDEGHYETARELSAAGLLAVSPAPDSLDLDALAGVCRVYVSAWDDQHADATILGSLARRVALVASPAAPQVAEWKPDANTIQAVINDLLNEAAAAAPVGLADPVEISHDDHVTAAAYRHYAKHLSKHPALSAPASADDEAAQVERVARAALVAESQAMASVAKAVGLPEDVDAEAIVHQVYELVAALATLKEGQR